MALDLDYVAAVNAARAKAWHEDMEPWTGADWSNAMCGEAGEAANVVKKLRRIETGKKGSVDPNEEILRAALGFELADTVLYAMLLADHYQLNLSEAIVSKFNAISEREGFTHRIYKTDPTG